jgi:hypothetical protein
MFQKRFEQFMTFDQESSPLAGGAPTPDATGAGQGNPFFVSTQALFQAAAAQALRDYELNKLFNPDFYDGQDYGADI